MNFSQRDWLMIGAAVAVGAFLFTRAATAAAKAVNPSDRDNLAYKAANQIGDIINDGENDDDFNLGRWMYNQINGTDT